MKKIFVVDDDQSVLFLSKAILAADKYSVVTQDDASQVFETIKQELPDLVITDIIMPEVNGSELAYALRQDEVTMGIPIIAVSAHPIIDDKTANLFDKIVKKPYRTEELLDIIHTLIGH